LTALKNFSLKTRTNREGPRGDGGKGKGENEKKKKRLMRTRKRGE